MNCDSVQHLIETEMNAIHQFIHSEGGVRANSHVWICGYDCSYVHYEQSSIERMQLSQIPKGTGTMIMIGLEIEWL